MLRVLIEDGQTRSILPAKLSIHDITGAYRLSHASVERILETANCLGEGPMLVTKAGGFEGCAVLAISPGMLSVALCPVARSRTTTAMIVSKRTATASSTWTLKHVVQAACFVGHDLVLLDDSGRCFKVNAGGLGDSAAPPSVRLQLRFNPGEACDTRITTIASDGEELILGTKSGVFRLPALAGQARPFGERSLVRALAAGCGRLTAFYANGVLRVYDLADRGELQVASIVLPPTQRVGLSLAICQKGVLYTASGALFMVKHGDQAATCLAQKGRAIKDGPLPGACVKSAAVIASGFGHVEFIDSGSLRLVCWRESLARLLGTIRALYESAGLDCMNGTLSVTGALAKLAVYNSLTHELDTLQEQRLGTKNGQGEVAALSKVVRGAPRIVESTLRVARDSQLRLVAQATGEENVEFFFSLTTGLASGHGSLTAGEFLIHANAAGWQTLARNPASLSFFTADDQTRYNRAYQRTSLAPATVVERLPLPAFVRQRRVRAAQIQENFALLRRATSKMPMRRLGRVSQQRRAQLSTIPMPATVTVGADLDTEDLLALQEDVDDGEPLAVYEDDDEEIEDAAEAADLPCVYAGSLVVLCPSHRQDGLFWLGVLKDTAVCDDDQVSVQFCETQAPHTPPHPDLIVYEVNETSTVVRYASIIAVADQRALDDDTVTLSRATYLEYSKLGRDAMTQIEAQRRQIRDEEARLANAQSDESKRELWRGHTTKKRSLRRAGGGTT